MTVLLGPPRMNAPTTFLPLGNDVFTSRHGSTMNSSSVVLPIIFGLEVTGIGTLAADLFAHLDWDPL